jgi:hypothetical protein
MSLVTMKLHGPHMLVRFPGGASLIRSYVPFANTVTYPYRLPMRCACVDYTVNGYNPLVHELWT